MRSRSQFGEFFLLKPAGPAFFGEVFTAAHKEGPVIDRVVQLHLYNKGGLEPQALSDAITGRRDVQGLLVGPHFASGFDAGTTDHVPYVAYDYVVGRSLSQLIAKARERREPIPLEHAFEIVRQASQALARASDMRLGGLPVVHGFLVPDFLHLSHEGKLTVRGFEAAFGLRRATSPALEFSDTAPYLSDHARAGEPAQPTDDVFSLTALLFELVTGEAPPKSNSYAEVIDQACSSGGGPLPHETLELLKDGMAPESRRIQSAASWLKRLDDCSEGFETTPFSLAFFLFRLFGTELEAEHEEFQEAKALRFGSGTLIEKTTEPTRSPAEEPGEPVTPSIEPEEPPPLTVHDLRPEAQGHDGRSEPALTGMTCPPDASDADTAKTQEIPLPASNIAAQSEASPPAQLSIPSETGEIKDLGPAPAITSAHPARPFVAGFATTLSLALVASGYFWLSRSVSQAAEFPQTTSTPVETGPAAIEDALSDEILADPLHADAEPAVPALSDEQLLVKYKDRLADLERQLNEPRLAPATKKIPPPRITTSPKKAEESKAPAEPQPTLLDELRAKPDTVPAPEVGLRTEPVRSDTATVETVAPPEVDAGEIVPVATQNPQETTSGEPTQTRPAREASQASQQEQEPNRDPITASPRQQDQTGELETPTDDLALPTLKRRPRARYPAQAKGFAQAVSVRIRVLVDERGRPTETELLSEPIGFGFEQAATRAAKQARWEPGVRNGEEVALWTVLTIEFRP